MRHVHRVSFDFTSKTEALEFFASIAEQWQRDDPEGEHPPLLLVHKDGMHNLGKHVHEYLVRSAREGNGRPVEQ